MRARTQSKSRSVDRINKTMVHAIVYVRNLLKSDCKRRRSTIDNIPQFNRSDYFTSLFAPV